MVPPTTATAATKYMANILASSILVPMAVKAVIELGIPDILAKAEGGKHLSASEILAKLPTKTAPGPTSFSNLRRLMKPLVQEGVFSESLNEAKQPAYGLTEVSKLAVRDHPWSVVPYSALMFGKPFVGSFLRLHEVILDEDTTPFEAECGMPLYEYIKKHPEYAVLFDKSMTGLTNPELKDIVDNLQQSGWLAGVKTFVDVGGGGQGNVVGQVVARNAHIQGINFDLQNVIERAPEVKGVQHVGGDFFKAVPGGDAMFMKIIMHNYDDDGCIKILKNCFEALPKGGKVIIAESMLPADSVESPKATFVPLIDLVMLGVLKGALERTEGEYRELMSAAGFSQIIVLQNLTGLDLIQGIKE